MSSRRARRHAMIALAAAITMVIATGAIVFAPYHGDGEEEGKGGDDAMTEFALVSSAFEDGESIPEKFTCDGEDVSPPLAWENVPEGSEGLALIVEDPDAPVGTFDHWLLYNLPADVTKLAEGVPTDKELENGALQGTNDFGQVGYRGPCPPSGPAHRYVFTLKALDTTLDAEPGLKKQALLETIGKQANVLAEVKLTGKYGR